MHLSHRLTVIYDFPNENQMKCHTFTFTLTQVEYDVKLNPRVYLCSVDSTLWNVSICWFVFACVYMFVLDTIQRRLKCDKTVAIIQQFALWFLFVRIALHLINILTRCSFVSDTNLHSLLNGFDLTWFNWLAGWLAG